MKYTETFQIQRLFTDCDVGYALAKDGWRQYYPSKIWSLDQWWMVEEKSRDVLKERELIRIVRPTGAKPLGLFKRAIPSIFTTHGQQKRNNGGTSLHHENVVYILTVMIDQISINRVFILWRKASKLCYKVYIKILALN